jgi:hypothetical protein
MFSIRRARCRALRPALFLCAGIFVGILGAAGSAAAAEAPYPAGMVADAALAQARQTLLTSWPDTPSGTLAFDEAAIRATFDPGLVPDPLPGLEPFADAKAYDDLTPLRTDVTWDSNGNGVLVVEYRGASGADVCTKRVAVKRTMSEAPPAGIVLYVGGSMMTSGSGNYPKVFVEQPSATGLTTAFVGLLDSPMAFGLGISVLTGPSIPPLNQIVPSDWVADMTDLAMAHGRYFTSAAMAAASPPSPWAPQGGFSGLCVIAPAYPGDVALPSVTLNIEQRPGCLLVLGGSSVTPIGSTQFYGVIYTEGSIGRAHGVPELHGMGVALGDFDDRSTMAVLYNDACVTCARWPVSVDALPDTEQWLDVTPPVTTLGGFDDGWQPAPVGVSLSAADSGGSGVVGVLYRLDDGDWTFGDSLTILGDGVHTIEYGALDRAHNEERARTATVRVDSIAPQTSVSGVDASWHAAPVTVSLSGADEASGLARTEYSLDRGADWKTGSSLLVSTQGQNTIAYRSADNAGNLEDAQTATVLIDMLPPLTADDADDSWHCGDVCVALTAEDADAGVTATSYRVDDGLWQTGHIVTVPAPPDHSADGEHHVAYTSTDAAGNVEPARSCLVRIDTSGPASSCDAPAGWVTSVPFVVTFAGDDGAGSGVGAVESSADGGSTWQTGAARTISAQGETHVLYRTTDIAGNVGATGAATVKVDSVAPAGQFSLAGGAAMTASATLTASSAVSDANGVEAMRLSVDGGASWTDWLTYATTTSITVPGGDGTKWVRAQYRDPAGNITELADSIVLDTAPPDLAPPITTCTGAAAGGWYSTDVVLTLEAIDAGGSGLAQLLADADGVWRTGVTSPLTVVVAVAADHTQDGEHVVSYHAVDGAGNEEALHILRFFVDTRRPFPMAPCASFARRGHTAWLRYEITETGATAGRVDVTIKVRNIVGRLVKTIALDNKPANQLRSTSFHCRLPRGRYRFTVLATDAAGNKQARVGSNHLTVR